MSTQTKTAAARVAELEAEVETRNASIEERVASAQDERRDLTDDEYQSTLEDRKRLEELDGLLVAARSEERSAEIRQALGEVIEERSGPQRPAHTPLLVSERHVRSHAEAIREGSTYGAVEEVETRAAITVASGMGSPGAWGGPLVGSPTTLRAFAAIPNTTLTGATAQTPSLTLPDGEAGVAETVAHGEYDDAAVVNLTALRYGRWSDVTSFVDEFDDINSLNQAHAVGIARDLNLADGTVIQTAAGSPVAFSGTLLEQNIRAAILKVAAATLTDPESVVVFGRSSSLAPIVGYAPTSGPDRGTVSLRVYGARVYTHEQATDKNVYVFNPRAFRVFSARLRSASTIDPTTGGHRFGQWLHSTPPAPTVVGGAAAVATVE